MTSTPSPKSTDVSAVQPVKALSEMTKCSFSSARTNVAVTISERFSNACSGR